MSKVLERTLAYYLGQPEIFKREIRAIHLNNYFTVVELDDTSVGACMSNYKLPREVLTEKQSAICALIRQDPSLVGFVQACPFSDGLARSVRTAIISALSAPILRKGEDPYFVARSDFPHHFFKGIKYAVVIGFGGFLQYIVRHTQAQKIHVSDLLYHSRQVEMDRKIALYRAARPEIELSVSDGTDTVDHLKNADFVAISGSTLGNDTLDGLLLASRNCKKVTLQGQSASIHPKELFEDGVHLVATTLKTRDVAKAAFWDSTGKSLRPFFENGLPWVYLWPKDLQEEHQR